jgi:hypothetical protein
MIPLQTRVKIVDDAGRANSNLLGKEGVVVGYKPNKYRENSTIPIVKLDSGETVSGWEFMV